MMGCLALFVNFLIPGLGTLLFTNRRIQGLIQIVISIINYILIVATFGIWALIGVFVYLGVFVWSLAATITFMSEQSAKKVIQQNHDQ
jgi:hypothetical protein